MRARSAFTLAELLIALLILGVIATFTIPKVLQSQQDSQWNSSAKEVAGMFTQAQQILSSKGLLNANTRREDFTPYFNYVRVVTTGLVDGRQTQGSDDCSTMPLCLQLHNGGILYFINPNVSFSSTLSTGAISFNFDPDGQYSGSTNGPGKAVLFFLYYDGRVRTYGTIDPNTCPSNACYNPTPSEDPPWFSWN